MPAAQKVQFAFLADAHKQSISGKVDAFGIFSRFLVWDTHAERACSLVLGVRNGSSVSEFELTIKGPSGKVSKAGLVKLEAQISRSTVANMIGASPFFLDIEELGNHQLGIRPSGTPSARQYWIHFEVVKQEWIELPTGEKLARILADPQSIKSARARVKCKKCGKLYTFELHLDPNAKLSRGSKAFPANGKFVCPKCRATHFLKDIEGQIRAHLGQASEAPNEL